MDRIAFEWDPRKNRENQKKHGVSFDEARIAFFDENARIIHDPDHSLKEDRFILLGSTGKTLVIVVHCYRQAETVLRIISARKATRRERAIYEERKP